MSDRQTNFLSRGEVTPMPEARVAAAMTPRLSIIVPYRNRAEHLARFIPHMRQFFSVRRNGIGGNVSIFIVEQLGDDPFNRGMLLNVGYLLGRAESDYCCFHDIDYLPLDADYSSTEGFCPILWYGAETRPLAPGSNLVITHNMDTVVSGVLLLDNRSFEAVNGYSNRFWGWGFEDVDLLYRCKAARIPMNRRKCSFKALDHVHQGFQADGSRTTAHNANKARLEDGWKEHADAEATRRMIIADGLSTAAFEVSSRNSTTIAAPEGTDITLHLVSVRLAVPNGI